eukprot:gene22778-27324_t
MPVPTAHYVNGHPLTPPFPAELQTVVVGMGCFWGAEKEFWQLPGVYTTAAVISYEQILAHFWENHDPTQGMRQGNDQGSQYRSAIFTTSAEQEEIAHASAVAFGERLAEAGYGAITTEIGPLRDFFYAEDYHQQYLAKNPGGYCPVHATGVSCPVGLLRQDQVPAQTDILPPSE